MPPKSIKEKGLTKSQFSAELAGKTGLTKTQVNEFFAAMFAMIGKELKAGRPVAIPSLVKVVRVRKAATPSRPGRNPSTGEAITIKAKPARTVVKVRALKSLKDLA